MNRQPTKGVQFQPISVLPIRLLIPFHLSLVRAARAKNLQSYILLQIQSCLGSSERVDQMEFMRELKKRKAAYR